MFLIPLAVEAESPPLTLGKSVSPDPVVAGEELTYVVTITNTGRVPLSGVVMTDVVPRGTTFVLVSGWGGDWWMQTPPMGGQGEIVWRHDGPVAPAQVSRLRFVVQVEATNAEPIFSQGCRIMAEGWNAMVSEAVTTQVLLPTPTPTRFASSYAEEAVAHFSAGNLQGAIDAYQLATSLEPDNALLWAELARVQTYSSDVLTNVDIVDKGSLKETSLYHIAQIIGVDNPKNLVDAFVSHEQTERELS